MKRMLPAALALIFGFGFHAQTVSAAPAVNIAKHIVEAAIVPAPPNQVADEFEKNLEPTLLHKANGFYQRRHFGQSGFRFGFSRGFGIRGGFGFNRGFRGGFRNRGFRSNRGFRTGRGFRGNRGFSGGRSFRGSRGFRGVKMAQKD